MEPEMPESLKRKQDTPEDRRERELDAEYHRGQYEAYAHMARILGEKASRLWLHEREMTPDELKGLAESATKLAEDQKSLATQQGRE